MRIPKIVAALILMVLAANVPAKTLTGRVASIAEGATLIVTADRPQYEVRLSGIVIPERAQPYGEEARRRLSELVLDRTVRVEGRSIDPFGRTVGRVWVQPVSCPDCPMTLDVSLALLTMGMAWWHHDAVNEQPEEVRGQ